MHRRVTFLAVFAIGGLCLSVAAAPRTAETPTDKRVKEFVAKVLTVLGKHDFDAYVKCCDVPFLVQPSSPGTSGILTDKEGFKTDIERRYEGKPTFDGRNH